MSFADVLLLRAGKHQHAGASAHHVSMFRFKILRVYELFPQTPQTNLYNELTEISEVKNTCMKKCHVHTKLVTFVEFYSSVVLFEVITSIQKGISYTVAHIFKVF